MRAKYAVTLEFSTKNPITVRGEVSAVSPRTMAARAIDETLEKNPGLKWGSMSILLDRSDFMSKDEVSES